MVIEPKIVVAALGGLDLLAAETYIVDLGEVENLLDFVGCKILSKVLKDFLGAQRILEVFKSFDGVSRPLVWQLALDLGVPS